MSVTLNAKGTSIPSFRIGKNGTTLYQGTNPYPSVTPNNGDYWLDAASNNLRTWSTSSTQWKTPSLDDVHFNGGTISTQITDLTLSPHGSLYLGGMKWPVADGTANQALTTDGAGTTSFTNRIGDLTFTNSTIQSATNSDIVLQSNGVNAHVTFAGDTGPGIITSTAGQDLYIDPTLGGGSGLILINNKWPLSDGSANQVLTTNGIGQLRFSTVNTIIPHEWVLAATTTAGALTSVFTKRSDSPQQTTEVTLPANSGNTLRINIQGFASDNTTIVSGEIMLPVQQVGTSAPTIGQESVIFYAGTSLCTLTYTGVVASTVPYVRITVTAAGAAATKTMSWAAYVRVYSTVAV